MKHFAHIDETGRRQTLEDHLLGTSALAGQFSGCFGMEEYGKWIGKLHDIGKYSQEFQRRLLFDEGKVDHSTAGAKAVYGCGGPGRLAAYCIAGHHTGLPDGGQISDKSGESTLEGRCKRADLPDFSAYLDGIGNQTVPRIQPPIRPIEQGGFSFSFLIRMLYSCLVDADFLDTEAFMQNGSVQRGAYDEMPVLLSRLNTYLSRFGRPESEINKKRNEILQNCIRAAECSPGLFTLTVPTGGGKTVASLAFSLNHAVRYGKRRVIYVIPYTSIIEQNAGVFRNIVGAENVLEHHSSFDWEETDESPDPAARKLKLSAENWDAPLIVTTNVQFFESLFANRSSRCRKLHNIAQSVIIFDEAQMIPLEYLKPCVRAIAELTQNYGCTAVLCSATQPALGGLFPSGMAAREICPDADKLYESFRRTTFRQMGALNDEELAANLGEENQVLCIVNTRKQAQNLFEMLPKEGVFHLSTLMVPEHRRKVLDQIRECLSSGLPCRVVSTSLIETGVDVDFPVVYRANAGLDSEIQAAGRCNRENKRDRENSIVYLFEPEDRYLKSEPRPLKQLTAVSRMVSRNFEDIASPEAITAYFTSLYHTKGDGLDVKNIVDMLENGLQNNMSFPFKCVAGQFRVIEQNTSTIVIPCGEGRRIADAMLAGLTNRSLMRKAGQYSVNVYEKHWQALYHAGALQIIGENLAVLSDCSLYSPDTGLSLAADEGIGIFT